MATKATYGMATLGIHGSSQKDAHGSPHTPIYNTTTFTFPSTADLLDVVDGRPRKIRVTCDKPLDDPSIVFLQWKDRSLQLFALPPVGESREVKYFSE